VVSLEAKPIEIRATPGQQHEATIAEDLLDFVRGSACLADGAYDSDRIVQAARDRELKLFLARFVARAAADSRPRD
jgi:hypothetical protein